MTSPEVTTGAPSAVASAIVVAPSWLSGSHMRICGLQVICDVTATVG